MNPGKIKAEWQDLRDRLHKEAVAEKCAQRAILDLSREYMARPAAEREIIDSTLAEWVLSDNESVRFDALALIYEYEIISTLPTLRQLLERLEKSTAPSAPYEMAKVMRIIGKLTANGLASPD
jgi:hypothetical protein